MTRADIDAVALVNGIDRAANIPALLAYIEELTRERDEARAQLAAAMEAAP